LQRTTIVETPGDFTEASVRFWANLYAAHDTLSVIEPVTPLPGGDLGDSVSDAGSDADDASPTGRVGDERRMVNDAHQQTMLLLFSLQ
jgi:hypothetical protein